MAWDTSPARSVSFTVTVAGVVRPHETLDWAQDITSDLPAAVTAGGQVAIRTGTIVWSRQELVETSAPSPWHKRSYWIPEIGEPVTIDAHDGKGTTVRVFTGLIDTVEGDAHGNRTSRIVAEVERHNKVVRYQALTRYGSPVATPVGDGKLRRQATTPVWLVHEIVRELGYQSVPPPPDGSKVILDAPLQGSTYNYFQTTPNGEIVVSHSAASDSLAPRWAWGPDGFGIRDAVLEWVPRTGGGVGRGAIGISCVAYSAHTEDALVRVTHGATDAVYLRVRGDGSVQVSTYRDATMNTHAVATKVPAGAGPHVVSAVFHGGSVRVIVGGVTETVQMPTPLTEVTRVRLDANAGSCVAGLQVWQPTTLTDHHTAGWKPTTRFRYGAGTHSTILTPSVRDRKARDVLDEYADALLSPIWIDGDGVLQIVTGKALHEQSPTLTVDALSDVAELSYSMASLDHRPTVEVSYEHAHHTNATATSARTTVWQGNGATLQSGEVDETFVEVPEDEEWIHLADPATATRLTPDNLTTFQNGTGSWWGLSGELFEDSDITTAKGSFGSQVVETLNPWAWKVTTTSQDPTGWGEALRSPTHGLRPVYQDQDLPIYRAKSHVRYESRTVSVTVGSDPYKGVLTHDAGKWITTTAAATDLCKWVHSMVSTPTPVLGGLVLRFNPTVDVGRKITVRAKAVFGVDFEALVLSVDHNPYDDTTTITARVTRVIAYAATLAEVDYIHIGQALADWDQAREGMTLDQVAAAPNTA